MLDVWSRRMTKLRKITYIIPLAIVVTFWVHSYYYRIYLRLSSEIGVFTFQARWGYVIPRYTQVKARPDLVWEYDSKNIDIRREDLSPRVYVSSIPWNGCDVLIPCWALVIPPAWLAVRAIGRPIKS